MLAPVAPAPRPAAGAEAAHADIAEEPEPETLATALSLTAPRTGLSPMAQAMVAPSDPLAAVNALSYEEKVALFS